MVKSMTDELTTIGIPFFAIKPMLVNQSPESQTELVTSSVASTLSSIELKALQKRMLELLEDLCKD